MTLPTGRGARPWRDFGMRGPPTPAVMRDLRESLDVCQARFEKLLGAGPDTVVHQDTGTVFQSAAADRLMRRLIARPEPADLFSGTGRRVVKLKPSAR